MIVKPASCLIPFFAGVFDMRSASRISTESWSSPDRFRGFGDAQPKPLKARLDQFPISFAWRSPSLRGRFSARVGAINQAETRGCRPTLAPPY